MGTRKPSWMISVSSRWCHEMWFLSKVMCYLTWLCYQNSHKVPIGHVCCSFIYSIIYLGYLCGYTRLCVYVGMHTEARVQHWCLIESLSMLRQGLSQDLELTNSAILSGVWAAGILLPLPPQHWDSTIFLHRCWDLNSRTHAASPLFTETLLQPQVVFFDNSQRQVHEKEDTF